RRHYLILLLLRPANRADEEGSQRSEKALHSRTVSHPLRRFGVGGGGLGEIGRRCFDKLRTGPSTSSGRAIRQARGGTKRAGWAGNSSGKSENAIRFDDLALTCRWCFDTK